MFRKNEKMVHSVTPEDDMKILDKKQSAKRFAYSQKKSSNPWDKFEENYMNDSESAPNSFNNKNRLPYQYKSNVKKEIKGFDLDNVWSIRNNISVTEKKNPTMQSSSLHKTGIYSRYKSSSLTGTGKSQVGDSTSMPKKHPAKQSFSFEGKQASRYWDDRMSKQDDSDEFF